MRRILTVGAFAAVGFLVLRTRQPKLHERLMARCGRMFERMPDDFPPKRMMRGIEDTRANTARILELLEGDKDEADASEDKRLVLADPLLTATGATSSIPSVPRPRDPPAANEKGATSRQTR